MKKCEIDKDTYFTGKNSTYLEIKNVKEYIDIDGIKRYLVEIRDVNKINMVKEQSRMDSINDVPCKDTVGTFARSNVATDSNKKLFDNIEMFEITAVKKS